MSHGVRLVGGCCGTTPEHIRQIKMAVKAFAPEVARASVGRDRAAAAAPPAVVTIADQSVPPVPRAERSQLARALAEGRFATIVELTPPKGCVGDDDRSSARGC